MVHKKAFIIFMVSLLVIAAGIAVTAYLALMGNPFHKTRAAAEVQQYLLTQDGYTSEQIRSVAGQYSFKSADAPYGAEVTFVDEPGTIYHYEIQNETGRVHQSGISGTGHKHKEQ